MADHLQSGVAVVTGGAGEIGRAMGRAFAGRGMTVVLSDIDGAALADAQAEIESLGGTVVTSVADISDPSQAEDLCASILRDHGAPRVVCANAGVMGPFTELWSQRPEDWAWVFRVNVFGVYHLIRGFVPAMVEASTRSHFSITGSDATYAAMPYVSTYHATKHALGAVAEGLAIELSMMNAPVNVHLVCPMGVRSPRLLAEDRERLRPSELKAADDLPPTLGDRLLNAYRSSTEKQTGDDVAQALLQGIDEDRFYVWPDPRILDLIRDAYDHPISGRSPQLAAWLSRHFEGVAPPN